MRKTDTDLPDKAEARIEDFWITAGTRVLDQQWTGQTVFYLLKPKPPLGMKWVSGRLTRIQKTRRPDDVWPEVWTAMSRKTQNEEIRRWEKEANERAPTKTMKSLVERLRNQLAVKEKQLKVLYWA